MSGSLKPMDYSTLGLPVHHQLKLTSTESGMLSNHLILCRPLLLQPSMFPSIRVFSNESVLLITWPKYRTFSFNINPSNECSGLISFRMDRSFPTAEFKVINSLALSFLYSPTLTSACDYQKTIALIRQTFVDKVMSLLFNVLSRLVIAFFPRSKCVLIS